MFGLSFLPLSYSNTQQLNGIQPEITLDILQDKDISINIKQVISIELYIERDQSLIL